MVATLTKAKPAAAPVAAKPVAGRPATALAKGKVAPGKPTLASKGKAKTAASTKTPKWVIVGATGKFKGYSKPNQNPVFNEGDRVVITKVGTREDQTVVEVYHEKDYAAFQANPDDENLIGDELFASELDKAEKLPVDVYAEPVIRVGKMDELLEEAGQDPLVAYSNLEAQKRSAFFYQGGMIAELYKDRKFQEYGDYQDDVEDGKAKPGTGWDRFCREQLGIEGGRKAHAAIQVYKRYSAIPDFDPEVLNGIGWVKLQIAANSVTPENVEEILDKARTEPTDTFRETIRTDYVADREAQGTARATTAPVKRTTFNFVLFEAAGDGVRIVIDEAKKNLGIDNESTLFEHIIMEWARENLGDTLVGKARNATRKKLKELKKSGVANETIAEMEAAAAALDGFLTRNDEPEVEENPEAV